MQSATAFLSGNLPAEPNSFIGRERDLAELARLLGDVLFGVADVARRLGIDPELALRSHALAFRDGVVAREVESAGVPIPDGPTH